MFFSLVVVLKSFLQDRIEFSFDFDACLCASLGPEANVTFVLKEQFSLATHAILKRQKINGLNR